VAARHVVPGMAAPSPASPQNFMPTSNLNVRGTKVMLPIGL
jgi:hypothetical protein